MSRGASTFVLKLNHAKNNSWISFTGGHVILFNFYQEILAKFGEIRMINSLSRNPDCLPLADIFRHYFLQYA